jgi:hypothetical protein
MKYANIQSLTRKLKGRLEVVEQETSGITGIATQEIDEATVEMLVDEVELGDMDTYLQMIYEFPLKLTEPSTINYLKMIAEDISIAKIIDFKFPRQTDGEANNDGFSQITLQRGLDRLQSLFAGTGIFVAGANAGLQAIQNDPNAQQQQNKNIVLAGEELKAFIGYDFNGDGTSDTDIFKKNLNIEPSFYCADDFNEIVGTNDGNFIENGVQTRRNRYVTPYSNNYRNPDTVSFW